MLNISPASYRVKLMGKAEAAAVALIAKNQVEVPHLCLMCIDKYTYIHIYTYTYTYK